MLYYSRTSPKVRELKGETTLATKMLSVASLASRVRLSDGILAFRSKATEMFALSKTEVGDLLPGDVLLCSLKGIVDCSSSFVDEFILNWYRVIRNIDNALLILIDMNEDVKYTTESAVIQRNRISKENIVLLAKESNQYVILGDRLEKNVLQIFSYVAEGKHITARGIAEVLGLELNSAGNRLKKLYDAHLAMRLEQSAESGGKFEYFLP